MKRWLLRICVFLVLGAIVNVAVAWTPLPSRWVMNVSKSSLAVSERWVVQRIASPNHVRWVFRFSPPPPSGIEQRPIEKVLAPFGDACFAQIQRLHEGGSVLVMGWATAQGFPMPAVGGFAIETATPLPDGPSTTHFETSGLLISDRGKLGNSRPYPFKPIWPGFAINTVFYAVILWLLFAGPFVLRRWRRIRRGLCPKCAYDLRGTPEGATACPECGAARLGKERL